MSIGQLVSVALTFLLILPAIILHEVAHGYVAFRLGDPTAKDAGRLTLNPIRHIDLWGTILMPVLLLVLSGGRFAFGYAKPVPINPAYFRDRRTGMLLTGIAGPATNLGLAILGAAAYRGLAVLPGAPSIIPEVVWIFVFMNLFLMFFNLIPIPPMDGSRVVQWFLRGDALRLYNQIEAFGFVIIILLISFGRPLLDAYVAYTVDPAVRLLTGTLLH